MLAHDRRLVETVKVKNAVQLKNSSEGDDGLAAMVLKISKQLPNKVSLKWCKDGGGRLETAFRTMWWPW